MSKTALASLVATEFNLTKTEADQIVSKVFDGITSALVSQGVFAYVGFGRLQVMNRASRKGRNPATGEPVQIKACRVVKFSMGESLKRELNTE